MEMYFRVNGGHQVQKGSDYFKKIENIEMMILIEEIALPPPLPQVFGQVTTAFNASQP